MIMNGIPTPNDGVYFTISTAVVDDNRKLGKAVRDKDGYFTDIPVAVLGTVTRNMTQYDTPAFLKQIKGPDTSFYKRLEEGTLHSEWGHPFVDMNSTTGMARLMNLDPQKKCNHIRSISVKKLNDLNIDIVTMDAKGAGPYGAYFDEIMLDPTMNAAFSLRGISKAMFNKSTGVTHKELINLVTFDSGVASGGFKEASKRYMESVESLGYVSEEIVSRKIEQGDVMIFREVAMEAFTDTELNEIFKAKKVVIGTKITGFVDSKSGVILDERGDGRSLFHSFMKVRR